MSADATVQAKASAFFTGAFFGFVGAVVVLWLLSAA